jgi:hypothetical protein
MSMSTILIITAAAAAWLLVVALVWLYCVSAAREDRRIETSGDRPEQEVATAERADETRTARS